MLAIVIPYYKIVFFEATLESLANQTDKRFKVYIGDDASSQNPLVLLEKYGCQFDFVYHRFETNLGTISLIKQWERCIALSGDEEWIMVLGDDDVLGNNVIEEFYGNIVEIEKEECLVVRFSSLMINDKGKVVSKKYFHPKLERPIDAFWRKYKGITRSSLSEYIFRKKSFLEYKFVDYPLGWFSDDRAWLDFADKSSIFSLNQALMIIRISDFSISGTGNNKKLKDEAEILFMKDIIQDKFYLFNRMMMKEFIYNFEVKVKNSRELTTWEWDLLFKMYKRFFLIIGLVKFYRRYIINKFNLCF